MPAREWTDQAVYDLLCKIDRGYQPDEDERAMLETREELNLWKKRLYYVPNSVVLLQSLRILDISDNQISELPSAIGDIRTLINLNLQSTQIKSLPDQIGKLGSLQALNLSFTPLTSLPKSIGQLASLKTLDLTEIPITSLPESIGQLTELQTLYLLRTSITALPESIGLLISLQTLNISSTRITFLPESIRHLANLQMFDLSSTLINSLPKSIRQLTNLQMLNLSNTPITSLPESIGQLTNLQDLYLSDTRITSLPESIGQLKRLQTLYMSSTQIKTLPESIGQLTSLNSLHLFNTHIKALPESFRQLWNLESLDLEGTWITALPAWVGELPSLQKLDLTGLTLSEIPRSLALRGLPFVDQPDLVYNTGVNLHCVILTKQSVSIFLEHPELILSLYDDQIHVPECRVLFLGDGDSGKTYTIRRIQNGGKKETREHLYPTKETPGVEIADWHVDRGAESFDIHFWDFGGQELLHSMHRCFLADQTCYVVTVKSRETKGTQRARYWLRNVTAFAPNSPILLYVNCWDNDDGRRAIDEPRLRKDYPNIKAVVYVSAKEAEDTVFDERLIQPLIDMAANSETLKRTVNSRWDVVRRAIAEESSSKDKVSHHYLTKGQYHAICQKAGVEDENAPALLSYFNDLGVCFSYHLDAENNELDNYKLLNPVWLTNAVYAVIEEGMALAQEGRVRIEAIRQMLGNRAPEELVFKNKRGEEAVKPPLRRTMPEYVYTGDECQYIIDVAAAYNLCYKLNSDTLFFPALCSTNTPDEALENQDGYPMYAEYQFRYDYLPDSVLHRLMIRCLKKGLAIRNCWLRGMMLDNIDKNRAIVHMDDDENLCVELWSKRGCPSNSIFKFLHEEILEVNKLLNLKSVEFIVDGEDSYSLGMLQQAVQNGDVVFGSCSGKKRAATELLRRFFEDWSGKPRLSLPIGVSNYINASTQYYYVDKTMLIKDFLDDKPMVSLFTRPRRFGKTLNMDMLRVFFEKTDEDTSKYFKDKAIWKQGEYYRQFQGKYPVIFVTFKDVKYSTWENTLEKLAEVIGIEFARHSELLTSDACNETDKASFRRIMERKATKTELSGAFLTLTRMLFNHHKNKSIIIIDEYDTPIQQGHTRNFYNSVIEFMQILFSCGLKDNNYLLFGFLTGILRVAKESIFSNLNNITINSILDEKYSPYFGFTRDEVKAMAEYYQSEDKFDEIITWYDGYRFGDTEIFNPWSVINYLRNNCRAEAYWQSTGSNEIIGEVLTESGTEIYSNLQMLLQGKSFTTDIDTRVIYPEIRETPSSVYSFLLVTGYLSLKVVKLPYSESSQYNVFLPNKEISSVYKKEILNKLLKVPPSVAKSIHEAIYTGNPGELQTALRQLLLQSVSVYDTAGENFYHGLVLGLCAILDNRFEIRSNRESGEGRYDIQLKPRASAMPGILIELKAVKKGNRVDLQALAQIALDQIEQKHYATELLANGVDKILKYGVAFQGKEVEVLMNDEI